MSLASRLVRSATATLVAVSTLSVGTPSAFAVTFSDVPSSHDFYSYVEKLVSLGAVSGQGGVFRVNDTLTRAELAKIVVLASGTAVNSSGLPTFTDVPTTHSLYAYVETAVRANIASGFGGGLFQPDLPVTRGQASKIIANAFKLDLTTAGGPHFTDVPSSHAFYVFIETLSNNNIVSGIANAYFGVDMSITRGQVAKIVAKAYDVAHGTDVDETPEPSAFLGGLTSDQTSDCVLDRMITKKDQANNIIVQAYTSGESAAYNQPIGFVVKVTDYDGLPVPGMYLDAEVTEGPEGSISAPQEVGRSGVYIGSYTSSTSSSNMLGGKVSLLISERDSNYTRPDGYEDVEAFPAFTLSFPILQAGRVGSVTTLCWDLTREKMTIDPNETDELDDYIVVIGLAEDGNKVGVSSGVTMNLFTTGDAGTTNSTYTTAGGLYVFRYQPYSYNDNTVVVKRKSDHMLQIVTSYRVFSSDSLHTEVTMLPRD